MIDNTEDTLVSGMSEETKRGVMDAANSTKKESKGFKAPWKKVAIGGISGIMLGGASAYAIDKIMENMGGEEGLKVATKVDDDQSFKEAFDSAHEEVGPGGLFEWHGNIYSTYKDEEWNALPEEERDAFNEKVVAQVKEMDDASDKANDVPDADNHDDVHMASADSHTSTEHTNHSSSSSSSRAAHEEKADDDQDIVALVDNDDADDIKIIGSEDAVEIAQNDDVYVVEVDDHNNVLDVASDLVAGLTGGLSEKLDLVSDGLDVVSDGLDDLSDNIAELNDNVSSSMEDNYLADSGESSTPTDEVFMA